MNIAEQIALQRYLFLPVMGKKCLSRPGARLAWWSSFTIASYDLELIMAAACGGTWDLERWKIQERTV
jgi:hypothetical protein